LLSLTEQPDRDLIPEIEIQLTISDILSGKDKVLEKTLALIKAK
jgi:hypothetical protein